MDDDEEEDHVYVIRRRTLPVTLVIVKSNLSVKQPRRHRPIIPDRQPKFVDKLSLLFLVLLFSDFRFWFTSAQNLNQVNVSRLRNFASLEDHRHVSNLSASSPDTRRLRHDTTRSTASKRSISFQPVSNSVPDFNNDDAAVNTSTQNLRDEGFASRFLLEETPSTRRTADDEEPSIVNSTAEKLVSPRNDETCSCFGGKRKVSRGSHGLTIGVQHRVLNTSEGITAGVVYRVTISPMKKIRAAFLSTESTAGAPVGFFLPSHKSCSNAVQFFSQKSNDSQISLNWSLPITSANLVLSNVIFRLCYQLVEYNHTATYEVINELPVLKGCEFRVRAQRGSISSSDLFANSSPAEFLNCSVVFLNAPPNAAKSARQQGLIVKLTRLNVQCNIGNVSLSFNGSVSLCGKLEEISPSNREFYFPSSLYRPRLLLLGRPVFAVAYKLVDFCYNVTLTAPNDSATINPLLKIFCNYKISLPYGYRVNVSFSIKSNALPKFSKFKDLIVSRPNDTAGGDGREAFVPIAVAAPDIACPGIALRYWDGDNSYVFCEYEATAQVNYRFQLLSVENQFCFRISSHNHSRASFEMRYEAVEIEEIVGSCGFGSITINSYCVNVIDDRRLDWTKAEEMCTQQGGHLASILDESSQNSVNEYLLKSPGYQDLNSYWIGASDIGHEGEFRWADSSSFSYTNWFAGWSLHGYYNRQPNDDGFSSQDCVELRRQYHVSSTGVTTNGSKVRLTPTFTWNDRDCHTRNYFLCEFLKIPSNGRDPSGNVKQECDQKLSLSEENDRTVIASPEFPRNYPDNRNCLLQLDAPPSYKIVIVFEEFVLENEPNCSYDYLEVYENATVNGTKGDGGSENGRRFCGDWSDKLKLLRYISAGPRLFLRFISDYSHSFSGYKAHISIEQVKTECPDNRQQLFNGSCYLFVSYPQVTWQTAQDICSGVQGNLASVYNLEEEQFVVAKIRESHEYTTSTIYWLGGKYNIYDEWKWTDNTSITFNAWVPMRTNLKNVNNYDACLGIQWIPSPSSLLPSGLYWVPISCQKIGGYVCKIRNEATTMKTNLNFTANGTDGELTSPNFPGNYYHNLDYWIRIIGPGTTRIIMQFHAFDLEEQKNCLYDYLEVYNATVSGAGKSFGPVKHCGHHQATSLHRLNYVSSKNEAILRFHSDYSVSGSGFSAMWRAVDISGCPIQTLTAKEGIVTSPNYPNFLLANLQCTTTVLAPVGREVWFELTDWDFGKRQIFEENTISESHLYLLLNDKGKLYPFQDSNVLTDGAYLSYGEYMKIHLRTGDAPSGKGFHGLYRTISDLSPGTRVINLRNDSRGNVYHLNFPLKPVPSLNFVQRFVAPLGFSIQMLFHQVVPSSLGAKGEPVCRDEEERGFIEVRDHFADRNGTWWQFCEVGHQDVLNQLAITSYLNTITIKQISLSKKVGVALNATLSVVPDPNFKMKIVQFPQNYAVESCSPNPCHNNGKCVSDELSKRCECISHFTGLFCALTICDTNPCVFGSCVLTPDYFKCTCQSGYQGKLCDTKMKPCSSNPCEGRGECIEKNNFTFVCQCHAWWEGERCDKKIANIPYKPLTDRMLEEPFWLGLLTVFVVLSILGLVWCARRHFPEKLEKLLAEEAERNRHYASTGRAACARAEMAAQNGVATAVNVSQTNTANSSPNPRTLLRRLGIRKPSLFSLTSPLQPTHTARTFSLDDLFKPSSSRSHVYKPRHSGNGQRKKSNDKLLKKQSLSVDESTLKQGKKVETVELKENASGSTVSRTSSAAGSAAVVEETSFIFPKLDKKSDKKLVELNNKNEKKVHFARLMSKVQAEIISSQSDVDVGLLKEEDNETAWSRKFSVEKPLAASAQTLHYESKSPHSTSSNQGSDSLSGSEMTLITASGENRRPSLLTLGTNGRCQKAASADSILAMFRKFSLSTGPPSESNSNFVSSSTSPTASSPPDEMPASDISSLSLYHPGSLNESPPYSNKLPSSTVQVSVLDPLNSQTTTSIASSNLLHPPTILLEVPNKCLSPIHEVPTPSPSPLMTPIMSRHYSSSSSANATNQASGDASVPRDSENAKCSHNSERSGDGSSSTSTSSFQSFSLSSVENPSTKSTSDVGSCARGPATCAKVQISLAPLSGPSESDDKKSVSVPTFIIHEPSPVDEVPAIVLCPGTPPPDAAATFLCLREEHRPSLELSTPPKITVTHTGEMDSDPDCPTRSGGGASSTTVYLSPFAGCSRTDRTASESNLSSSGYSSMTSPGPSRCGSSNPLCPSEGEDLHSPRRSAPIGRPPAYPPKTPGGCNAVPPSDSETLSDDHQMESNDESFSTDQIAQKIEHGDVKSAKELEMFIENEQTKRGAERDDGVNLTFGYFASAPLKMRELDHQASTSGVETFSKLKSSLQPPSSAVEVDAASLVENRSPVSSRSESPLSDRTVGFGRFSPMFYGRMTDSDGVYDWTSSECTKPTHRKHFGRRREKQRSKSPHVKAKRQLLDVPPAKPSTVAAEKCRKPSPKRRARSQLIKASPSSSSSSSESADSRSKICLRRLHSPHKGRYLSKSSLCSTTDEVSGDDGALKNLCSSNLRRASSEDLRDEDQMEDHGARRNSRFGIIGRLSSMLSQEKKPKWNTDEEYSASIPLLTQRDEPRDNVPARSSQTYSFQNVPAEKRGQHSSECDDPDADQWTDE